MKHLTKKGLSMLLLAALMLLIMPISAFAGGDGIAELSLVIKDSQTPAQFTLTPQDLTGDFVFTNGQGDAVTISPALLSVSDTELSGLFAFVAADPEEKNLLVKSQGTYTLTQYPTLPQGYAFAATDQAPSFTLDGLEPYQGTFEITLLVNDGSGSGIASPPGTSDTPSEWAVEQVTSAISLELVPDALQSKYTQATTRAEFCALAVALYENVKGEEISERKTFADTDDINVQKMGALNVVNGVGNDKFAPDDTLTREQAATMLSKLADAIGKPLPEQAATFADNGSISSWAAECVGQVQAAVIMSGVDNNMFAPKDPYTREQSISTILRLYDFVK